MITTDWRQNAEVPAEEADDIRGIAAIRCISECSQLLVFPHSFDTYDADFGRNAICDFDEGKRAVSTKSILGFVGRNGTRLTIRSRFTPGLKPDGKSFDEKRQDMFLHYMLQRVYGINIFDMRHNTTGDPVFDFMLYMFPYYLKKALRQGLYREYTTRRHNDADVRGTIDICRHIRENIPFKGSVSYRTREYVYDNSINQLIRHTVEHVRSVGCGAGVLGGDAETRKFVSMINDVTCSYDRNSRQTIINRNLRPFRHPLLHDYEPLRRICLRILRHERLKYGNERDEVYGVLFDGAWLWEEYVGIVMKDILSHFYKNKGRKWWLFDNGSQQIIPDYLSKDRTVVADAKYMPLDTGDNYGEEKATAVYYKTITYMYRWNAKVGLLLFPIKGLSTYKRVLGIEDAEGRIVKLGLPVPQEQAAYSMFCEEMRASEKAFVEEYRCIVS